LKSFIKFKSVIKYKLYIKNIMNNQYDEARQWYDDNWPFCIRLDIDWTCRGYDYPEYVVEWIKNDQTNWKKINNDNGGTYEYFSRINNK